MTPPLTAREVAMKCAEIADLVFGGGSHKVSENMDTYRIQDHAVAMCSAAIRAYAATLPPEPAAVPEGWKLVPVEPTTEMVEQGWNNSLRVYAGAQASRACWVSMLAAASKPEVES